MGKEKPKESVIGELKTFLLHGTLLIIILFIGAVAFVMLYDKYVALPEAKKMVTKRNHLSTVLYISDELQKCSSGETTAMDDSLTCSNYTATKVITVAASKMVGKNSYKHSDLAVRVSNSNTNDEDVGYINLSASGSNIIIKTCNKTPCNKEANRQSRTVSIE